ncbi:MAG: ABC transporter permease [Rhizobacter sp.]|jgi:sodium transport system permease protein|nr:ABC transporter permease [Rhizobacter sp.]MBP6268879.1 ABC transporter permease [Rhizobacter sp.]
MSAAWVVYVKEIVEALRDRRTLMVVLFSSVLMGPLLLVALSALLASFEASAESRVVYVAGSTHAPGLVNFLERQTRIVKPPPADYEARLRTRKWADPVVVVPPDFEAALQRGETPFVEVVSDSGNAQAQAGAARVQRLLTAYLQERATLALALRGVSPELLAPFDVEERDLASSRARAAQITGMLPFFVIMAVLYGALNAALDTTAGERERGSLEPLLMNPARRGSLVLGKWGAVASVAMLIATLSCFSFIPAQWLLRSDTLQAMFQYGWREALAFLVVLLPLCAAMSALLMAIAIRCRTFKEAQASSTVALAIVSLLPLVTVFDQRGESPWHLWVPALAQSTLMTRVLKGEPLGPAELFVPLAVSALLTLMALAWMSRRLSDAAVR